MRQPGQDRLGKGRGVHGGDRPIQESGRPGGGSPEQAQLGQRHREPTAGVDERQPGQR